MNERAIFEAALDLADPVERAAHLDRACAGDLALRQRLDELLAAQEKLGSFLAQPLAAEKTGAYLPIAETVGTKVGPYVLREQIGEGGFGLVFVAEQTEPVKRKVALKVIKPGMDSRQVIARFEAERQALAMMDHPNIARVLDAGATESGRPYFVMELVRGIPITEYCDKNQLAPKERLELFITVCQAIQHAHQKGIIHRDVKPSNVLVTSHDGKPVAKVIDFGVAKAVHQQLTDRSIYTNFATMVGTPLYMSPEQAEMSGLDIDTRSDIYSLGVLLYELLTGTTPLDRKKFAQAAYDEVRRLIREEEPPKPSTRLSTTESIASIAAQRHMEPAKLSKFMRGDLDWITMKCLEKDRTRRYDTANGLARDVQRYLNNEPVEASPPSSAYRFRKFVRRNRGQVIAASLILFSLLAGLITASYGFYHADMQRQRAEGAELSAVENALKAMGAAEAEKQAKETAQSREAAIRAVIEFVEDRVFAAARPKDLDGGLGYDVKLADAITAALPYLENSFSDQPLIEARLQWTLGTSFMHLGKPDVSEQQFRRARDLYAATQGPEHPDTLMSICHLAESYAALGRFQEARTLCEDALKLWKARFGPDHPDNITCMTILANIYDNLGRLPEALALHSETLLLAKTKLGPDHASTLANMNNLANSYHALGRHADALALREETLKLQKAKFGPEHPVTLACMHNLGVTFLMLGRGPEAHEIFAETLKLRKFKLGPDHPETLQSMTAVAASHLDLGRFAEALELHEETVKLMKARLGPDHPATLKVLSNLARSFRALGRLAEALAMGEETFKLQKAKLGLDHPDTLTSMSILADTYADLSRHAEALALREETLNRRRAKLGADHPDTLTSMSNLARSYATAGRHAEALALREETLNRRRALYGPDHPDTLTSMSNVGSSYYDLGRFPESLTMDEETLKLRKAKLGADHPDTLQSMHALAVSLAVLDRRPEAVKLLEETIKLRKAKLGPEHPETLRSISQLAYNFLKLGQHREAVALYEELLKSQRSKLGFDHPNTLTSMTNLALSQAALGRHAEALALREENLKLSKTKHGLDHPDTLRSMGNLAASYAALDRHPEALKLREETLALRTAKLGADHPDTRHSMNSLAYSYLALGRHADALRLLEKALLISKSLFPPDKAHVNLCTYDIACVHTLMIAKAEDRGKQADLAMDWLQRAVAAGYKEVAHMKKDKDLDALRDREDFKKLLAELEAKAALKKEKESAPLPWKQP